MSSSEYHKGSAAQSASSLSGLHFCKVEGLGNDFILIDERDASQVLSVEDRVRLCDRHLGVGADGVLTIQRPAQDNPRMHVTNADGSVPEMCGNGLRCVAWWLCVQGEAVRGAPFVIAPDAGPKEVFVSTDAAQVRIEMGPAWFKGVVTGGELRSGAFVHEDVSLTASAVSMGNPHLVLFDALDSAVGANGGRPHKWGPDLCHHPWFPDGANVGFARQTSEQTLDLVVYERGAGLTLACGTGACAAVVAHVEAGRAPADTPISVTLPGGSLQVTVASDFATVAMEGPARVPFRGVLS